MSDIEVYTINKEIRARTNESQGITGYSEQKHLTQAGMRL